MADFLARSLVVLVVKHQSAILCLEGSPELIVLVEVQRRSVLQRGTCSDEK